MNSPTSLPMPQNSESKSSPNSNPTSAPNFQMNRVLDEIARGKEYCRQLEQRQLTTQIKSKDAERKDKNQSQTEIGSRMQDVQSVETKLETKPVELYKQLYPDVYVERIIVPDYTPNYDEFPRITRNIVDRDTLSMKQHMNLLAQPKIVYQRRVDAPYIVRRKVLGPSPRIVELARPKKRQTLATCKQYRATMDQLCIENCHRNVQDVTFVPVQDAVYFIELKKRRPIIEKRKLQLRMKRLQEKISEAKMAKTQEVIWNLYSSLKCYLLPSPLRKQPDAECEECAKGTTLCANCTKIDDEDVKSPTDNETLKLSSVVRHKMEKMIVDGVDKIEPGSYMNLLLVHISEKLAVWMKRLVNSEAIESEFINGVTTEVNEVTTETAQVTTEATQITTEVTEVTEQVVVN